MTFERLLAPFDPDTVHLIGGSNVQYRIVEKYSENHCVLPPPRSSLFRAVAAYELGRNGLQGAVGAPPGLAPNELK